MNTFVPADSPLTIWLVDLYSEDGCCGGDFYPDETWAFFDEQRAREKAARELEANPHMRTAVYSVEVS